MLGARKTGQPPGIGVVKDGENADTEQPPERQVGMRKLLLALLATATLAAPAPAGAATKTVSIYGYGFSPKSVTITQGDIVTWVNRDNANHQILADKGGFVSPI